MQPINLTIVGTEIQLDVSPDGIKIIAVSGPRARDLADLALHRADLLFAKQSLDELNDNALSAHVRESLWRSAIVHFFKCFQRHESRSSLKFDSVYEDAPAQARANFDYFRQMRNKHLVHDENSYAQSLIGAVLNDGTKGYKVEQVIATNVIAQTLDAADYANFYLQVERVRTWVDREFGALCEQIKMDLESVPYHDLLAMQPLTATLPNMDELQHPRKRP